MNFIQKLVFFVGIFLLVGWFIYESFTYYSFAKHDAGGLSHPRLNQYYKQYLYYHGDLTSPVWSLHNTYESIGRGYAQFGATLLSLFGFSFVSLHIMVIVQFLLFILVFLWVTVQLGGIPFTPGFRWLVIAALPLAHPGLNLILHGYCVFQGLMILVMLTIGLGAKALRRNIGLADSRIFIGLVISILLMFWWPESTTETLSAIACVFFLLVALFLFSLRKKGLAGKMSSLAFLAVLLCLPILAQWLFPLYRNFFLDQKVSFLKFIEYIFGRSVNQFNDPLGFSAYILIKCFLLDGGIVHIFFIATLLHMLGDRRRSTARLLQDIVVLTIFVILLGLCLIKVRFLEYLYPLMVLPTLVVAGALVQLKQHWFKYISILCVGALVFFPRTLDGRLNLPSYLQKFLFKKTFAWSTAMELVEVERLLGGGFSRYRHYLIGLRNNYYNHTLDTNPFYFKTLNLDYDIASPGRLAGLNKTYDVVWLYQAFREYEDCVELDDYQPMRAQCENLIKRPNCAPVEDYRLMRALLFNAMFLFGPTGYFEIQSASEGSMELGSELESCLKQTDIFSELSFHFRLVHVMNLDQEYYNRMFDCYRQKVPRQWAMFNEFVDSFWQKAHGIYEHHEIGDRLCLLVRRDLPVMGR